MDQKITEQQAIDLVIEKKGEVFAATAWEGFVRAGRGFVATDIRDAGYCPASLAARAPSIIRKRLRRLVESYQPEKEMVVLLIVEFAGQPMLALGKRQPALSPEACLLKHAGTPGCPPMRVVPFPVDTETLKSEA